MKIFIKAYKIKNPLNKKGKIKKKKIVPSYEAGITWNELLGPAQAKYR